MPELKGIHLSIISQVELRSHPEFPHPESSQFTYRSPDQRGSGTGSNFTSPAASSDSKADKILGRPSTVSVYIPSLPGTRFWLRYDLTEAAAPLPTWFYFKLFMNGRLITAWGTKPTTNPKGQVMRALFDPSQDWNYSVDGVIYKNNGSETRPFYFSDEVDGRSAAADGGLIEVRVFRAKGREQTIQDPVEYKAQDQYGIALPSDGLVDTPDDLKFYDWHLLDPKDKPFATFNFHYRSWDSLVSLHLIPADHPRWLLLPSPSQLALNGVPLNNGGEDDSFRHVEIERLERDAAIRNGAPDSFGHYECETGIPDQEAGDSSSDSSVGRWIQDRHTPVGSDSSGGVGLHIPRPPSPHFHRLFHDSGAPRIPRLPSLTQEEWDEIHRRPLPPIPTRDANYQRARSPSEASGTGSLASITPSLRSYVDRDSTSPPPILGVAKLVVLPKPAKAVCMEIKPHVKKDHIIKDDAAVTEPLMIPARRPGTPARVLDDHFSNVTLRKHRKASPSKSGPKLESKQLGATSDNEMDDALDDWTPLSLTESEWLGSPSKARGKFDKKEQFNDRGKDMPAGVALSSTEKVTAWHDAVERATEQDEEANRSTDKIVFKMPENWT